MRILRLAILQHPFHLVSVNKQKTHADRGAQLLHHGGREQAFLIAGYFDDRPTLTTLLWLIDSEVGPTRTDLEAWEHLVEVGRPIRVVGTKIDKVRSSKRPRRKADLTAALGLERGDVRWVSADKQIGIDELRTDVVDLLTL